MEIDHIQLKEMMSKHYKEGYKTCFRDTINNIKAYGRDAMDCDALEKLIATLVSNYNNYPCIEKIQIEIS